MVEVREDRIEANGVEFAYLEAGDGPLALCVHGFPDSAHTWRHLLPELAAAGYRAVAPFTRGYAPTSVPSGGGYHPAVLAADGNALRDPANLQAALGYYRDTLSPEALAAVQGAPVPMPPQPLLYVHGGQDGAVGAEVAEAAAAATPDHVRVEVVDGTGHFLHLERPSVVNDLILRHLAR